MNDYLDILLRTVTSLILLLLIARILGKQTISNMTFHDFVAGITLGAISANLAFNNKIPWAYLLLSLSVFTLASFIFSLIALKSRGLRGWISGSPTVLIQDGKVLENNMRKARYTLDSLNQGLREKNVFNMDEVEFAILEDNGKLSVLKKEEHQFVTKKDLQLLTGAQAFPVELIMDGQLIEKNMESSGISREWLERELEQQGKQVSDVFYAVRGTKKQLFFDFYKEKITMPVDKE
ncbi:DUF421 domain-containing protein [Paenibacillus sp. GD4]|uniref:DUF421 domain-containing protein n=1 Tax=Paenibacillus sp. GD4 TaxID=3068890 RepID=UPI002796E0E5|nr:DUF421 domain-containing protein [Paenibacillus sp. GD4]MDQ1913380.1 DUF421 domain-containing protein [Paenibacillus sp. GD4]